jgi:hypothetical protein
MIFDVIMNLRFWFIDVTGILFLFFIFFSWFIDVTMMLFWVGVLMLFWCYFDSFLMTYVYIYMMLKWCTFDVILIHSFTRVFVTLFSSRHLFGTLHPKLLISHHIYYLDKVLVSKNLSPCLSTYIHTYIYTSSRTYTSLLILIDYHHVCTYIIHSLIYIYVYIFNNLVS